MANKFNAMVLGAVLGLGAVAFTGTGSSAAALLPLAPSVAGHAEAAGSGIVEINHKKYHNNNNYNKKWNKKFGKRCNYYSNNCRHHYRGRYYETPWWTLPLIVGGAYAANNYYDDGYDDYDDYYDYGSYGSRHVRYCLDKYRSYNPRNNTWRAHSGRVHQCRSPYF
jgi:hypothetical protein